MDDTTSADPLRPIEVTTRLLGILLLAGLLATAVFAVVGALGVAGGHVGITDACASVPSSVVPVTAHGAEDPLVPRMASGGTAVEESLLLCDPSPVAWQRVVYLVGALATSITLGGFLLLVRVLVRRAGTRGLFSPDVARLTRVLGWYVMGGALAAALVSAVADASLVGHVVPGFFSADVVVACWETPWTALLAGIGVLSIARVMQRAAAMRQDLDATI
jgi:hypothetical protein